MYLCHKLMVANCLVLVIFFYKVYYLDSLLQNLKRLCCITHFNVDKTKLEENLYIKGVVFFQLCLGRVLGFLKTL